MGLLREPVATRSHHSWRNIATRYGRFCVQKRTEEGLSKNTNLRHRFFYIAEDLFPFRIIFSSHPDDFNDSAPASSTLSATGGGGVDGKSSTSLAQSSSTAAASDGNEGIVSSFLQWFSGRGEQRDGVSTSFFFAPFSASAGPMERYTVATSSQLSGILEAWGLLLAAWEPEEAELNVLSFASPAMASPTSRGATGRGSSSGGGPLNPTAATSAAVAAAAAARVPFYERWRRTFGRIEVMCAETGMEQSLTSAGGDKAMTPPSPSLNDNTGDCPSSESSPNSLTVSASRTCRGGDGLTSSMRSTRGEASAAGGGGEYATSRSFAGRRHVHISDVYYSADSPAALMVEHFFDVLLVRVVDLLMWRDPQLTACCLGILISVYGYSAWASAFCYLAGEAIASSSSHYCAALYTYASHQHYPPSLKVGSSVADSAQASVLAERLWWGAPLFMISVLAYPWAREQRRRTLSPTDREHLRSVDHALRWLCSTSDSEGDEAAVRDTSPSLSTELSPLGVVVAVARRVSAVPQTYRLPISVLLLFNVIGAFATWEVIFVLFLWPMLIVGVGLAGVVVATQCITNR